MPELLSEYLPIAVFFAIALGLAKHAARQGLRVAGQPLLKRAHVAYAAAPRER